MSVNARYAIITPYFQEKRHLIERCIASVECQSLRTDHFLIADGFPQDWIDSSGVRHFKLDRSHGDFGNTPRGVGALIAIAEEYSGLGLLDADNWLEPDHVQACLAAASAAPRQCDYVIARRTFRRPDESIMPIDEEPEHVDTNCFFFLRGAFSVIPHWAMMPKQVSSGGDRFFNAMLRERGFIAARAPKATVNYLTMWEAHYRAIGETPPPEAKPATDTKASVDWLRALPRRDNEISGRLMGFAMLSDSRSVPASAKPPGQSKAGRNDPCPCGSGRKYKHCHGT
jgi:SEC-C motif-containing protein